MRNRLNIQTANAAMERSGLSQTAVAQHLDVSREAVSQWLNNKSFPRPGKLLQLGRLLGLSFDKLVIVDDPFAPQVAFRKMRGAKTKEHHLNKAREMGRLLRHLTPFLTFDTLEMPPTLKSPSCDYGYLRKVAVKARRDINLGVSDKIEFTHLIKRFGVLQAVIIPVLWGNKQRHENAIHIYLPDSGSTWVYLNLDTNIHDFKFWMAHELGHCMSPSLEGNEAEDFADAFAANLLYPHELAERAYAILNRQSTNAARIERILALADEVKISPYTVEKQVNNYAAQINKPKLSLGRGFPGTVTNFNKAYPNLSAALFGNFRGDSRTKTDAREYITTVEKTFETPFFGILRRYLNQHEKGPGFVQTVLDMPLLDARSIHAELT